MLEEIKTREGRLHAREHSKRSLRKKRHSADTPHSVSAPFLPIPMMRFDHTPSPHPEESLKDEEKIKVFD
jgi:hypothetical protein